MTTYLNFREEPLDSTPHKVEFVNSNTIECDYIHCSYKERFDNVEDAETAKGIHEEQEAYQEVPV